MEDVSHYHDDTNEYVLHGSSEMMQQPAGGRVQNDSGIPNRKYGLVHDQELDAQEHDNNNFNTAATTTTNNGVLTITIEDAIGKFFSGVFFSQWSRNSIFNTSLSPFQNGLAMVHFKTAF